MAVRSLLVACLLTADTASHTPPIRHYYIAAEDGVWDYAPARSNLLRADILPYRMRTVGTQWPKTRYVEYTDSTFSRPTPQPPWLGILGPVIRAEVGDSIIVDFLNRSSTPHNIHPHGLRYDKASEGALYVPFGAGARVRPGERFRYRWLAPPESGPRAGGPRSVVWMYHAHDDEPAETNAGLVGPIIVTARGDARPDGSPNDVDREFVVLFMIFDESHGSPDGFFYTINGFIYGNLPGLDMVRGDRVRWHLLGMGNEIDVHTPHWHGNTVGLANRYTDVVELLPASMVTVDMTAVNPGTWLFHCQVAEHIEEGMVATYTVHEPARSCPVALEPDFWSEPERFTVKVTNRSGRPIVGFGLRAEYFAPTINRVLGFPDEWRWDLRLPPGGTQMLELQQYFRDKGLLGVFHGTTTLGWAVQASKVLYPDGTAWTVGDRDDCFALSWRDGTPPSLLGFPAAQPALELPEDYPARRRVGRRP